MKTKLNRLISLIGAALGLALLSGCGTMPGGGSGGHHHVSIKTPAQSSSRTV